MTRTNYSNARIRVVAKDDKKKKARIVFACFIDMYCASPKYTLRLPIAIDGKSEGCVHFAKIEFVISKLTRLTIRQIAKRMQRVISFKL